MGRRPLHICFVVLDDMLLTGTVLPLEMWRAAGELARAGRASPPRISLAGPGAGPVAAAGIPIAVAGDLSLVEEADLVYLPALWRNPERVMQRCGALRAALTGAYARGAVIAAAGTGTALLAHTGLLDGRPATTHWYYSDTFQRRFPAVQLKREHFITQAGTLYCAASINALADLTVHLIERFTTRAAARHVERHFSAEVRRASDKYSFSEGQNRHHPDELMVEVQLWMEAHLAEDITVAGVAQRFGLSTRSLVRRFHAATDRPLKDYLRALRLTTAADLLRSTNLSIAEVAERVGYRDARNFARAFRAARAIAPREYRRTVRAKLFTPAAGG
ncbi:MAG: helix-turn-helix domain-containing protein [Gammaproteobacteria bacterium]|nr:helix-turn-helix domain-containing protein [Gammaproteobacteria bacterium]